MGGPGTSNRYTNFDTFPSENYNGISSTKLARLNKIFKSTEYTSLVNTVERWNECQTNDLSYANTYWGFTTPNEFDYSYGKAPDFRDSEQFPDGKIKYHPNLESPGPSEAARNTMGSIATDVVHVNIPETAVGGADSLEAGQVKKVVPPQKSPGLWSGRVARSVEVGKNYPEDKNGNLELFDS